MPSEEFIDAETGDEAACVVRVTSTGQVGLAVTLRSHGDLEVVLDPVVAERIASSLTAAADKARSAAESQ